MSAFSALPPLVDPKHLKGFLAAFGGNGKFAMDSTPDNGLSLNRITLVGALYDSKNGFVQRDRQWLWSALQGCHDLGFSFSHDPQVSVFNLRDGFDFLGPARPPADLIVCCFVYHPGLREDAVIQKDGEGMKYLVSTRGQKTIVSPAGRSPFSRTVSEHCFERGVWHRAAQDSGAKAVVTFSAIARSREPRARHFLGEGYVRGPTAFVKASVKSAAFEVASFRMESVLREDVASLLPWPKLAALAV